MKSERGLLYKIGSSFRLDYKKCRVKYFNITYAPNRVLIISLRSFRTPKSRRKDGQLAIRFPYLGIREIAFERLKKPRKKRSPKKYTVSVTFTMGQVASFGLIFIGIIGIVIFGYQIINPDKLTELQSARTIFSPPTPEPTSDHSKPFSLTRSEPSSISIPRIGVTANIETVDRAQDGTIQTPDVLRYVTGWYKYSPTPGEIGPSIIVGHVDSYKGPSVFWRLSELQTGDSLEVTRKDGKIAKFEISSVEQFTQSNFPSEKYMETLSMLDFV